MRRLPTTTAAPARAAAAHAACGRRGRGAACATASACHPPRAVIGRVPAGGFLDGGQERLDVPMVLVRLVLELRVGAPRERVLRRLQQRLDAVRRHGVAPVPRDVGDERALADACGRAE